MKAPCRKILPWQVFAVTFLLGLGFASFAYLQSAFSQTKAAWQVRWQQVLTQAKNEGRVVVFGPPGAVIRKALIEGFAKAFAGIEVEYIGGRSTEEAVKLQAERDGGIYNADVFLGAPTTALFQLKPMGALDPIEPSLILPEVKDVKYWRENVLEFSDKEGRFVLVFVTEKSPVAIYDSKQVRRDEIDELYKLLNPKLKGKIVINDPGTSGAGVPYFRFIWVTLGSEKASEYYRRIRAQAGAVDRDQRRMIEWIASGKYALLLSPSAGLLGQLRQQGLRFDILEEYKDIGTTLSSSFGTVMLINKAPHPNAAAVFINWLLTRDGQITWSRAMNQLSRRVDVPADNIAPYMIPAPGGKYWKSYTEDAQTRTLEEKAILKELFQR
jgi:iron(III) transport system substrate-binding protein